MLLADLVTSTPSYRINVSLLGDFLVSYAFVKQETAFSGFPVRSRNIGRVLGPGSGLRLGRGEGSVTRNSNVGGRERW
jgi:hypothetical protein